MGDLMSEMQKENVLLQVEKLANPMAYSVAVEKTLNARSPKSYAIRVYFVMYNYTSGSSAYHCL